MQNNALYFSRSIIPYPRDTQGNLIKNTLPDHQDFFKHIGIYRCNGLKIDFRKHGIKNKLTEYNNFKEIYNLKDKEIAYIGDDIIDLSILVKCGLSVTPNDAREYMKKNVDIITNSKGGEGVFRDVADYILDSQQLLDQLINNSKKGK